MLFLCLAFQKSYCCSCAPIFDFKSKDDLKEYDFISLVSIKELAPLDSPNTFFHLRKNGNIQVEVIELFKGNSTGLLIDQNFNNDCAFNLQVGERWLFFGNTYNGKTAVDKCGYSVIYRKSDGMRDWKYYYGIKQLDLLQKLYKHQPEINKAVQFYPSGEVEIVQNFKNGKLNNVRKIYYPNGKVYVQEKFKEGKRTGFRNVYTAFGQLIHQVIYKKGLAKQINEFQDTTEAAWYLNYQIKHHSDAFFGDRNHDISYFVKKLDSLRQLKHWEKQIKYFYTYSKDGRSYQYKSFNYKGDLEMESYLDWDKQLSENGHFYENGKIQYVVKYDQKANIDTEYDYDANGKRRDFVKKCDACKFYFNKNEPAATPEAVYIQ